MGNIITLDEYRDYDDLPSPAENEDQIGVCITLATAYIESKTGRTFEIDQPSPSPHDAIEILNGNGTCRLYTHNAPVTGITKLEYWDGQAWQEYDIVSYPYTYKDSSNIIYFTEGHRFIKGWQNTRVTFEYGFDAAMPTDLKQACYQLAKHFVLEADRLGINSQSDGEQTFSYEHAVPKFVAEIIQRYKTAY
ncbi:MAG: hypothetical protein WC052_04615 [Patescibacteria group bacterium]|jgi:hypothetical protein